MNKEKNKLSIVDDKRVKEEAEKLEKEAKKNLQGKNLNKAAQDGQEVVQEQLERMNEITKKG